MPDTVWSRDTLVKSLFEISYLTGQDPIHSYSRLEEANLQLRPHNRGMADSNIVFEVFISQLPVSYGLFTDSLGSGLGSTLKR